MPLRADQPISLRASKTLTLNDAQNMALKENREVIEATLEVSQTSARLKAAITQRYPKILALAFIGQQVTSGNSGRYGENFAALPGVFQPVTQQYRLGMQVEQASLNVRIAQQRLRLAKQRTVADVKRLYLNMLALQSAIRSLEKNFEFLQELARYLHAEVRRGSALSVDSMVVDARVAKADYEVDKAKDDINTMGQNLNRLLGRQPLSEIILLDEQVLPLRETPENEQIAEALAKRPELSELKSNSRRSNLEGKVQMSGYIPDVSFGATGIFSRNLDITLPKTFVSIGFLATWEPWDWGRRIQLNKEALDKMRQERIKLHDKSDSVSIEVDKARRDVKLADKEVKAGTMAEESTREQLRVVHKRFLVGAALLKDVLEAQSSYTQAVAENVKAKTDMTTARVALDQALGRDF